MVGSKQRKARGRGVKAKRDAWRAAREPEVLKAIGRESKKNGTDRLTTREIEEIIRKARGRKTKC